MGVNASEQDKEAVRDAVSVRGGAIFWRGSDGGTGVYKNLAEAIALRNQFADTRRTDWFYPIAQSFVEQLDAAIQQVTAEAEEAEQ